LRDKFKKLKLENFNPLSFCSWGLKPSCSYCHFFAPFMQFNGNLSLTAVSNLPNFEKIKYFLFDLKKRASPKDRTFNCYLSF